MSEQPEAKIIDMKAQAKLIQEARDARAKRKAERMPHTERLAELLSDARAGKVEGITVPYPGGIDDMEIG